MEEAVRHGWIGCVFKVESELCIIYGVEEKEMAKDDSEIILTFHCD